MALPVSWKPLVKSKAKAVAINNSRMTISALIASIVLVGLRFGPITVGVVT